MMLVTAGLLLAACISLPVQQASPPDLRSRIEAQAIGGDFQAAMALAHGIGDDPERFAIEADLLFRARSYRAALGRAQEAFAGGVNTPRLLARGIGSALWLEDVGAGLALWPPFELAIAELPAADRAGWSAYAADLRTQLDQQQQARREVHARVQRARRLSFGVLVSALGLMAWLLPRRHLCESVEKSRARPS